MKTTCVVVIGHVDHGKTTLVHALTGIETDRLAEEKARGLSITPGFAHRAYASGIIDFIDAPGHQDFTQAMISGATGANAVLAVISGVEGIGAQTLEHLKIAEMLGLSNGVIAVTKSDRLEPVEYDAALNQIRRALSGTAFNDAPIVLCSASTGDGIEALHQALEELISIAEKPFGPLESYLPVDRVFSVQGRGTIVTGTLLGQPLRTGDTLVLQPKGRTVTVRGLQSRGADRDEVHPSERVAANLRGASAADVTRGTVLSVDALGVPSTSIDCHVEVHGDVEHPLKHMQQVRVHFGTSSEVAQVRLFGGGEQGRSGFVQFRFSKNVMVYAGQRAIIRRLSPSETIAAAVILDPQAAPTGTGNKGRLAVLKAANSGCLPEIATALCQAGNGAAQLSDIARLARVRSDQMSGLQGSAFALLSSALISPVPTIDALKKDILERLAAYHADFPLRMAAPISALALSNRHPDLLRHAISSLVSDARIEQHDTAYAIWGHDPISKMAPEQQQKMTAIEASFLNAGLVPLTSNTRSNAAQDQELTALLLHTGRLVCLQNVSLQQALTFHTDTLHAAAKSLHLAFPRPHDFTTSQARTALATSRKIIVPILEHFDRCGITIRTGNTRQMAPSQEDRN